MDAGEVTSDELGSVEKETPKTAESTDMSCTAVQKDEWEKVIKELSPLMDERKATKAELEVLGDKMKALHKRLKDLDAAIMEGMERGVSLKNPRVFSDLG